MYGAPILPLLYSGFTPLWTNALQMEIFILLSVRLPLLVGIFDWTETLGFLTAIGVVPSSLLLKSCRAGMEIVHSIPGFPCLAAVIPLSFVLFSSAMEASSFVTELIYSPRALWRLASSFLMGL